MPNRVPDSSGASWTHGAGSHDLGDKKPRVGAGGDHRTASEGKDLPSLGEYARALSA